MIDAFKAEHGVSFLIQTSGGQVLFDTGQTGNVFLHNAHQLDIDLGKIDALAISHAHFDHTGGLESFLQHSRPTIPFYASPDVFRERYSLHEGEYRSIGMRFARESIAPKVDFRLNADPVEIIPGVWTTGEIKDRSEFEGRSAGHVIRVDGEWQSDPYRDDLSLVLETEDGLIVICGCCHAGLLNTLKQVKAHFGRDIIAVLGGTHLGSATDDMLAQAVNVLKNTYAVPRLFPNHCTGKRAYNALAEAFGDKVQPCRAGTIQTF